jgi:hypothetical protein
VGPPLAHVALWEAVTLSAAEGGGILRVWKRGACGELYQRVAG